MRLALLLVAALPLAAATCGVFPGVGYTGPAGALGVRTDSLLIAVDSLQFTVAIGYPQIVGSTATVPAERVAAVNAAIRDSVRAIAESFRPEAAVPPDERDSFMSQTTVEGGTDAVLLHGDVLSGVLLVGAYLGGAHGSAFFRPVAVDLRTARPVALADVFRPGTPWADSLAAHADRQLLAFMLSTGASAADARSNLFSEGYAPGVIPHVAFALQADSLLLQFGSYEVAAYVFGVPTVTVAYADLDAFLRPDGPVARIRRRPGE